MEKLRKLSQTYQQILLLNKSSEIAPKNKNDEKKKVNKQCLFDTPRTVMTRKENWLNTTFCSKWMTLICKTCSSHKWHKENQFGQIPAIGSRDSMHTFFSIKN